MTISRSYDLRVARQLFPHLDQRMIKYGNMLLYDAKAALKFSKPDALS